MEIQEKLWKWYTKHRASVDVLLDMACDMIPGGKPVLNALRLAHGWIVDKKKEADDKKIEEMENLLGEIRPVVLDVVEEIEEMGEFQKASSPKEKREAVEKSSVRHEIERILPRLGQSIAHSVSRLEERKIVNNRYELKQLLGKGGQGEVYLAYDKVTRLEVALKLLPKELSEDTSALDIITREYQRLVKLLVHDNIVQYRQMDKDERQGRYFLVMDYVEGTTLRKRLLETRGTGIELQEAVELLMPVGIALDYAHKRKLVHCDLKPENILIQNDGKALLTDFGLSKEIRTSLSLRGKEDKNISGTLPYMSPEQYKGWPALPYTDIWALGVIVYEMVAGYHPFNGNNFEHFYKIVCENPILPLENIPKEKWAILERMLAKEGKNRPISAREALESLNLKRKTSSPSSEKQSSRNQELEKQIEEEKKKLEALKAITEKRKKEEKELKRIEKDTQEIKARQEEARKLLEKRKREQEEEERKLQEKEARRKEAQKKQEEERSLQETDKSRAIKKTSKDGRYNVLESGIILDTKTHLEWLVGPDKDTTWNEAKAWAKSIDKSRYGTGWRMPERKELPTIYEKGKGQCNIDSVFVSPRNCLWVWSGEIQSPSSAWYFDFRNDGVHWFDCSYRNSYRVFAVRAGRR